jgi:hypothetical protein
VANLASWRTRRPELVADADDVEIVVVSPQHRVFEGAVSLIAPGTREPYRSAASTAASGPARGAHRAARPATASHIA